MNDRCRYVVEPTREGIPTLAAVTPDNRKIYLHSRYDPSRESMSLSGSFNPDKYDVLICLGVGLGYHLLPLKEIKGYRAIILIEALPGIEKDIAENTLTSFLSSGGAISCYTGLPVESISSIIYELAESKMEKGLQILEHPASFRAFPEYYSEARDAVKKCVDRLAGNIATRHTLGMRYLRNIIINTSLFPLHRPVNALFNTMRGKDAIVLTSGPSVEMVLPRLRHIQDSFYIIAADSALGVAAGFGIRPDAVISIDPQPQIREHLLADAGPHVVFVHSISSHHTTLQGRRGCISLNSHPLSQLFEEMYPGMIGSVDSSTGTVAGDAIALAIRMGFKSITMTGYDFSFPSTIIYARGSAYQRRYSLFMQARTNPVETSNMHYVYRASRGYLYNSLHSRKSFIQYKNGIERLIATCKDVDFRVISEAAPVPIEGTRAISLADLEENHPAPLMNAKGLPAAAAAAHMTIGEIVNTSHYIDQLGDPRLLTKLLQLSLATTDTGIIAKAERTVSRLLEKY